MKITHVIFSFQIGGSETMLVDILNEQVATTNELELLIINKDYDQKLLDQIDSRVKIVKLNRIKGYNTLWAVVKLNYYFMRNKPDVIHFHDHTGIQTLLNRKIAKTVLTLHLDGFETSQWYKYSLVCSVSKAVKDDALRRSGIMTEVVYNGVKLSQIKKKNRDQQAYRIVQVARLDHHHKAQDVTLDAFAILQGRYPDLDLSLDFIGDGVSASYLKNKSEELGVRNVTFLGTKTRAYVYENLASYDLLVLPSNQEGFGLVVAEALAAGLQVLVSDIPAPQEIIDFGRYGSVFERGNVEDYAKKLEEVLILKTVTHQDPSHFLAENFDIHSTSMRYIQLYENLINQDRK